MTTKVRIEPSGHHVLVSVTDSYQEQSSVQQTLLQPAFHYVDGAYVPTGQGPWEGYATTSRTIAVVDLEPTDDLVIAANGEFNCPVPK